MRFLAAIILVIAIAGPCCAQADSQTWYAVSNRCEPTSDIQMGPLGHTVDGNPDPAYVISHLPVLAYRRYTYFQNGGLFVGVPPATLPNAYLNYLYFVQGRDNCLAFWESQGKDFPQAPEKLYAFTAKLAAEDGFPAPPAPEPHPHMIVEEYPPRLPEVAIKAKGDPCFYYGVPPPAIDQMLHAMGCFARQP